MWGYMQSMMWAGAAGREAGRAAALEKNLKEVEKVYGDSLAKASGNIKTVILNFIQNNPMCSQKEISEKLGLSIRDLNPYIISLYKSCSIDRKVVEEEGYEVKRYIIAEQK